jgi:tryptophanyl-tRNA synthetase
VARRFNHLYGRGGGFEARVAAALARLPKDDQKYFERQRKAFGETGAHEAWAKGEALVRRSAAALEGWTDADTELLLGHLKGSGRSVLVEPQALHTEVTKLPGLDGQKMSKSYGNAVLMRDDPDTVAKKVRGMTTDPARVRRSDPGDPAKCPVWDFHRLYSDEPTQQWVQQGCTTAGIGCLECKQPVIDAIVKEQQPWRERAAALTAEPKKVHWIVENGTERARTVARQTMRDVREAMGLAY